MDPSSARGTDPVGRPDRGAWAWLRTRTGLRFGRGPDPVPAPAPAPLPAPTTPLRVLFLDDDPVRARVFLQNHPQAVWVTTVGECISRLHQVWDEVHLDHDLGGQTYVDSRAEDCGMEVIRWLCKEPRPHLNQTRFFVHTHNSTAGLLMVLEIRTRGYQGEFRPFGMDLERLLAPNESTPTPDRPGSPPPSPPRAVSRWMSWKSLSERFLRRRPGAAAERG